MNSVYVFGGTLSSIKNILRKFPIKKGKIFIKVNLSIDKPYPAATTQVDIVKELIKNLKGDIFVGDSNPSSYNTDKAFKRLGYDSLDAKLVNLSNDKKVLVKCKKCIKLKEVFMPKTIIESDAVVSLTPMKTHVFTTITASLKNMFGCLPGLKVLYHQFLDEAIHDAVVLSKPTLGIIDARVAMEGRGPVEGTPKKVGVILASNNLVSLDCEAAKIMGFDPRKIKHISLCAKTFGGMNYKLVGKKIRLKFKPATKGFIDMFQDYSVHNPILRPLFFRTPLFHLIKNTAKFIKDINRKRRFKN